MIITSEVQHDHKQTTRGHNLRLAASIIASLNSSKLSELTVTRLDLKHLKLFSPNEQQ